MATDLLDLSYTKSTVTPTTWDASAYEHKKFSKRRRSIACHCEDSGNACCTLGNCNKYKYFAAISMNNIAIYNSVEGTYELIDTRDIMQDNSLELKARHFDNNKRKQFDDNNNNDDEDAQYEYIKADTDTNDDDNFIGSHLPHLHYIIRRTQRRRCS